MITFKCKMCGGDLEFEPGATVAECPFCGVKQTLPRLDDDRRANLYDRANHFRRQNEYDKAMAIYEQILSEDRTDAEAYWSLVLCRYGIEYVEDPVTRKRVPTVNRAQYASVLADDDYKSALQYADPAQRVLYESEAEAIAEIQRGILDISRKEQPFDVFICYKETDANGRRTPDSVLATDLYHQLTKEGFRVFFSRITLEDKIGTAYEPYIFAALNSAKVMVVLGTKPEYFNAVWVKNEWSRYLALIRAGAEKVLVPAYRDMDPYDLPEEFAHLQAQDMGKLGFMQDLIRGIKKLTAKDDPKPARPAAQTVVAGPGANIENLMKRARLFMEDGNWMSATEYLDKVLDENAEYAPAYAGKVQVSLRMKREAELAGSLTDYEGDPDWQRALRFAAPEQRKVYEGYAAQAAEAREEKRKEDIYAGAAAMLAKADTPAACRAAKAEFAKIPLHRDAGAKVRECEEKARRIEYDALLTRYKDVARDYNSVSKAERLEALAAEFDAFRGTDMPGRCRAEAEQCRAALYDEAAEAMRKSAQAQQFEKAAELFRRLGAYRDAQAQARKCSDSAAEVKRADELRAAREREEQERRIEKERARQKRNRVLLSLLVLVLAAGALAYLYVLKPMMAYDKAVGAMEAGNYDEATALFEEMGDYRDAAVQAQESQYRKGLSLMNSGKYDAAVEVFNSIGSYGDSSAKAKQAQADKLFDAGYYAEAYAAYIALDSEYQTHKDDYEQMYVDASRLFADGDYDGASMAFNSIAGYKDSTTQAKESQYQKGLSLMNSGQYDAAVEVFNSISSYGDSSTRAKQAQADELFAAGNYAEAYMVYAALDTGYQTHKDDYEQMYVDASKQFADGDYDGASKAFNSIAGYKDSVTQAKESQYQKGLSLMNSGQYHAAAVAFKSLGSYNDAATQAQESQYQNGLSLMKIGQYDAAVEVFKSLGSYNDAATQAQESQYRKGMSLMESEEYDAATEVFDGLSNYNDAATKAQESQYLKAAALNTAENYDEAYLVYASIAGYKDVDSIVKNDGNISAAAWRAQLYVGNTVTFGAYDQDGDTSNGAEAIEWIVLANDGKTATLISRYGLDAKPYNTEQEYVTWETCTLRKWLNGDFLNAAFSADERAKLETVKVTADRNPKNFIDPGNDTQDKVFLLSIDEANKYFSSDSDRMCKPTKTAVKNGASTNSSGACWWWLRSPGYYPSLVAYVRDDGSVYYDGCGVYNGDLAVRPVVVLRLS